MKWLAALMLLTLALAGCADDEPGPNEDEPGDEPMDEPQDEGPQDEDPSSPGSNVAPGASITASVTQGVVPQDVMFEMDGSDADGDALTWTLDATGDGVPETEGAALPANYTHSYVDEGIYEVTFEVSDGTETTVQTITVDLQAPADPDAEPPVIQEASVSWAPGQGRCGASYSSWQFGTPAAGITHNEFPVAAATWGQEYVAELIAEAAGIVFIGIDFYDADGTLVADGGTILEATGEVSGVVPEDAAWVLAFDCFSTAGQVNYHTTGAPPS